MKIQNFLESDCREIADLFHNSVHAISTEIYTREQLEAWAPSPPDYNFWEAKLTVSKPFLATINGKIVGFIELEPNGHIDCMYVHSKYQRQGIATALFCHASKVAIEKGCQKMYVEASIPAKRFFENAGFQVATRNIVKRNGQELVNYSMYGQPKP